MTTGGRRIKGSGAAKIAKPNAHIRLTTREDYGTKKWDLYLNGQMIAASAPDVASHWPSKDQDKERVLAG